MKKIYLITRKGNFFFDMHLSFLKNIKVKYSGVIIDKKKYTKNQIDNIKNRINIEEFQIKNLKKKSLYYINHNSKSFLNFFSRKKVDLIINLGTPRIFSRAQIKNLPPILNCHPGILPYYKGCNSPEWAFLNKDNIGATVHLMNEYIDGGKIIFKKIFRRKKFKNYKDFRTYIHMSCIKFYCKSIKKIISSKNFNKLIYNKVAINSKDAQYWNPMSKSTFSMFIKYLKNKKN